MLTKDDPIVEISIERMQMSQSLLRMIADSCWSIDNDRPTDSVDPKALDELRKLIKSINEQLQDIETATVCMS